MVEYCVASDPESLFETQVVARDIFSTALDGLTPSTEYDVRVRGENAVGRSVPSATMRTKTDGEWIEMDVQACTVESLCSGCHWEPSFCPLYQGVPNS